MGSVIHSSWALRRSQSQGGLSQSWRGAESGNKGGWRDGSVHDLFAVQAREPEFHSQHAGEKTGAKTGASVCS